MREDGVGGVEFGVGGAEGECFFGGHHVVVTCDQGELDGIELICRLLGMGDVRLEVVCDSRIVYVDKGATSPTCMKICRVTSIGYDNCSHGFD